VAKTPEILRSVPLFSCFSRAELRHLTRLAAEEVYRKGDVVCREGDPGDRFFVVLSGELEVWTGGARGRVVSRLSPGECLGEMSLLLGGARAATVSAARTSRLLALDKTVFDRFVRGNATALEYLSRVLCKRLVSTSRGEVGERSATTVGVTGRPALKGRTLVASVLAALLAEESGKRVLLVSIANGGSRSRRPTLAEAARAPDGWIGADREPRDGVTLLEVGARRASGGERHAEGFASMIARAGGTFPFIVFAVRGDQGALVHAAEEASDVVVEIVDHPTPAPARSDGRHSRVFQVLNLYNEGAAPIPINHCEPFVLPDDPALRELDPLAHARYVRAHPWSPVSRPLRRLARKILGGSVGIAMGGGAAFAIAHIGVLRVLEASDVPVDLVAGSSMGSIIATGYAAGLRAAEMAEIAQRIGTKRNTFANLLDLTLFQPGLLTGDRLSALFSPLIGSITSFEDLALPLRTVATDIETGERVSIGSGALEAAWRASCAVPMVWTPVRHEGRVLVDGGVADPVPATVVGEMGADLCIGVNVVPRPKKGAESALSRLYREARRLNPLSYLGGSEDLPNMFDLVMNSMQTLQHELGSFKAISADVRIDPDLSGFTWTDFYKPAELIARGAEAAERAVPDIKRVLARRPPA
jgi:NTE family protein